MKVLVLAAHPDDEVLGMGGTIKKFTRKGYDVKIVIMATGIRSRRSTSYENVTSYSENPKDEKMISNQLKKLQNDAQKASKILGVKKLEMLDFPDNEMDKISNLEVTKKIEEIIEKFKPKIVFTHSKNDLNIDHRILYNATITATRPSPTTTVKQVLTFEVPSSTEWNFPEKFSPNIFVNIEKDLPYKIKAMKSYKNEIRKFPHPRSVEGLEIIAKKWGTVAGFNAAEPFYLIRELKDEF